MVSLLIRILVNNYNDTADEKVRQGYGVVCGGMGIILNIRCAASRPLSA